MGIGVSEVSLTAALAEKSPRLDQRVNKGGEEAIQLRGQRVILGYRSLPPGLQIPHLRRWMGLPTGIPLQPTDWKVGIKREATRCKREKLGSIGRLAGDGS